MAPGPRLTVRPMDRGRYSLRMCETDADLAQALALRAQAFGTAGGARDSFDQTATQIILHDRTDGDAPVGTFRLCSYHAATIAQSYAAQFYDLAALGDTPGIYLELGRFCTHPDRRDPDILRLAWAAMTTVVDDLDARMLFGCSSFDGVDPAPYLDAFALLRARHLAPPDRAPGRRAPQVVAFDSPDLAQADPRRGLAALPPLLRTYLMMRGWVSDHAVIDHQMRTLHVFTGLEIAAIPETRKRLLRGMAEGD